jgi:hypothetical protein
VFNQGSRKVANSVEITGGGSNGQSFTYTEPNGNVITFYGYTFSVVVNGQAGVYTVWIDVPPDDPNADADAAAAVMEELEEDPGALGGISENDQPDQDQPDQPDGDPDGDGVLADGEGGGDDSDSA